MDSRPSLHAHPCASPGLPGPLARSVAARPPQSPRAVQGVRVLVTSPPVSGFGIFGSVATAISVTRPNRVRLRWARGFALAVVPHGAPGPCWPDRPASRRWSPAGAGPELHVERAIHMADTSQSARTSRVTLAHRRHEDPRRARRLSWRRAPLPSPSFVSFFVLRAFVISYVINGRPGTPATRRNTTRRRPRTCRCDRRRG